jgi:hypothetical protein
MGLLAHQSDEDAMWQAKAVGQALSPANRAQPVLKERDRKGVGANIKSSPPSQ